MPTYFINDVVCRVQHGIGGRTEIDIGTVDYPSTTSWDTAGPKTVEELVSRGFGDGWEFWVTWGHRGYLMDCDQSRRTERREKVSAQDESIFLLDRSFSRGMYVRHKDNTNSIGIVQDIDVSVCVQNSVGSVVADLEIHSLEFNWVSEDMLGMFVSMNGWVGQIVEIEKEAQMSMERDSQFIIKWTERLHEFEFLKEKLIFPQEWERMEPHLRFKVVGDFAQFTTKELSTAKWISQPASKTWAWPILRPYHYKGHAAEVESIAVRNVTFLWLKRIPHIPSGETFQKPLDCLDFPVISELVKSKKLHILSCINCEDKVVGSTVFVHKSVNTSLNTLTYDKWAKEYLNELHEKCAAKDGREPVPKRQRNCFKRDFQSFFTGIGKLAGSVGVGAKNPLTSDSSFPGRVIARTSRVAVQFSAIEGIECYDSTDLVPVILDEALKYPLGTLVMVHESQLGIIDPDGIYYGIISGYDMMQVEEQRHAIVKLFHIPLGTLEPIAGEEIPLSPDHIIPHPILTMRAGDLLIRNNAYDHFIGGTFIRGLDSGKIVVAVADGSHLIISPCRALSLRVRSIRVSAFDAVVNDMCCVPESPLDPDWNGGGDGASSRWVAEYDIGHSLQGGKKLVSIHDPTPSCNALAFWSLDHFLPFDARRNVVNVVTAGLDKYPHTFGDSPVTRDKDEMYKSVILENLSSLDPKKFWFKVALHRKDLLYCAMEGPVGTIYEDILFLFDIRLPPIYHGAADVYFISYFEYDVIPDTPETDVDNYIPFSWRTGTVPADTDLDHPQSYAVKKPYLVEFFSQIQGSNLQADPLPISNYVGGSVIGSLLLSSTIQKLTNDIYVRTELTRYIARQILAAPSVWKEEIFSFYRIHLPKYFYRQISWILENTADKTYMGSIYDKRDDLLENLHELMFIYNKLL